VAARIRVLYVSSPRLNAALERGARAATEASGGRYEVVPEAAPGSPLIPGGEGQPMTLPPSPIVAALTAGAAAGAGRADLVVLTRLDEFGLVGEGAVLGLEPQVRSQTRAARAQLEGFSPGVLDALRVRGELRGLPLSAVPELLHYDPRLFDAAGVARPHEHPPGSWTWDACLDAARRLTRDDADGNGQPDQYGLTGLASIETWIWQAGGEVLAPDGRRALVAEAPAIEAIVFYAQLLRSAVLGRPNPNASVPFSFSPQGYFLGASPAPDGSGGPRAAMMFASAAPVGQPEWWPLRAAEPPRWRRPAAALRVESALAAAASTPQPALAYEAMLALAVGAQEALATPARAPSATSGAQLRAALDAAGSGRRWEESEAQALVAALRYGRALPLSARDAVRTALNTHVVGPLTRGEPTPPESAARAAATAIDAALRG